MLPTASTPQSIRGNRSDSLRYFGKEGRFRVEIPLNSFQSFFFRGKLQGDPIGFRVVRWEASNGRLDLALQPEPGLPKEPAGIWAVCQSRR